MATPAAIKNQNKRVADLEARLAELEQKLSALAERKKPGPKPKESA